MCRHWGSAGFVRIWTETRDRRLRVLDANNVIIGRTDSRWHRKEERLRRKIVQQRGARARGNNTAANTRQENKTTARRTRMTPRLSHLGFPFRFRVLFFSSSFRFPRSPPRLPVDGGAPQPQTQKNTHNARALGGVYCFRPCPLSSSLSRPLSPAPSGLPPNS